MKLLRLAFFIMCVALVIAALKYERHEVLPLSQKGKKVEAGKPSAAQVMTGLDFTQEATVDGFLRRDGVLYDVYSLGPLSSDADVTLGVEKKCPT